MRGQSVRVTANKSLRRLFRNVGQRQPIPLTSCFPSKVDSYQLHLSPESLVIFTSTYKDYVFTHVCWLVGLFYGWLVGWLVEVCTLLSAILSAVPDQIKLQNFHISFLWTRQATSCFQLATEYLVLIIMKPKGTASDSSECSWDGIAKSSRVVN